jgi:hypothetical protein
MQVTADRLRALVDFTDARWEKLEKRSCVSNRRGRADDLGLVDQGVQPRLLHTFDCAHLRAQATRNF